MDICWTFPLFSSSHYQKGFEHCIDCCDSACWQAANRLMPNFFGNTGYFLIGSLRLPQATLLGGIINHLGYSPYHLQNQNLYVWHLRFEVIFTLIRILFQFLRILFKYLCTILEYCMQHWTSGQLYMLRWANIFRRSRMEYRTMLSHSWTHVQ